MFLSLFYVHPEAVHFNSYQTRKFLFFCFGFGVGGGVAEITQSISLLLTNFSMPSVQFSCEEEFNMTI